MCVKNVCIQCFVLDIHCVFRQLWSEYIYGQTVGSEGP